MRAVQNFLPALLGMDEDVRASPPRPQTVNKLLYFRIEYRLMITVPTHKHQKKSLLNTQKTIYVFTSGRVIIVSVQTHSRKKMTTAE